MKMKKLFKVFTLTIATSLMALSLTACGGGGSDVKSAKEPVPVSEALNQESIWFYIGEDEKVGKDEDIRSILVFDGKGNVTRYKCSELTFSDLKDLSDDEIIALAKEQDKSNFDSSISRIEEDINEYKESASEKIASITNEMNEAKAEQPDKASEIEKFYSEDINKLQTPLDDLNSLLSEISSIDYREPEAVPYTVHIETDHTGNATQTEYITYNRNIFNFDLDAFFKSNPDGFNNDNWDENDYWSSQEDKIEIFPDYGPQTVYDMNFRGFVTMVTLVNEDHKGFMMDTPDTKGIEVD